MGDNVAWVLGLEVHFPNRAACHIALDIGPAASPMKNILLLFIVSVISLELFSLAASKANLLLFNGIPSVYRTRYSGDNWRTQRDPWGSWHKPNKTDRHQQCFDVQYRSNEVGARDTPFTYEKTSSQERYILLGDSFAEGYGVNFEDTAQSQLERLLGVEVYNFGSAGYFGPVQYYLIYKELGSRYQHDGLILFFLPANDFTDNDYSLWKDFHPAWYRPYYKKRDDGYDVFYPNRAAPTDHYEDEVELGFVKRFLIRYTFTANTFRTIKYLFARSPLEKLGYSGYFDATLEQQKAATYFIEKIVKDATPRRTIIFVIPNAEDMARIRSGHSYKDQYWIRKLDWLRKANENVTVIDMAEKMPNDYKKLFLSCDSHWNELGNLRAAEIIAAQLRTSAEPVATRSKTSNHP
jgi:hypothetical protein